MKNVIHIRQVQSKVFSEPLREEMKKIKWLTIITSLVWSKYIYISIFDGQYVMQPKPDTKVYNESPSVLDRTFFPSIKTDDSMVRCLRTQVSTE